MRLLRTEQAAQAAKVEGLKAAIQAGIESNERGEGEVVDDLEGYFDKLEAEIESEEDGGSKAPE